MFYSTILEHKMYFACAFDKCLTWQLIHRHVPVCLSGMRGSSFEKNIRKRRGKPNTSSLAESENETLGKVHEASMLTDMQSAEQAYSTPDPTSKRVQADEQYRPEPHFSLGMAASALRQNRFGYLLLAENVAILCMIVCNRRVQRCLQLLHSRCLGLSGVTASKADVH